MDQFATAPQQEESSHLAAPLKALKISVFVAVIVIAGVYVSHQYRILQQEKTVQVLQTKADQEKAYALVQAQKQDAIKKRDVSLCPIVANTATGSSSPDAECVASINRLAKLDSLNLAVIQATKEKNEKLCDSLEKDLAEICIKAVRAAISGVAKPINPLNPLSGR